MRLAIFASFLLVASAAFGQVKWESSLEGARKAAARAGKPVLVDFAATWCGPCRMMEEETFANAAVRELLGRMVCVRIDVDRQPALAAQYEVSGIPRILLLPAAGGQPLMDLQGFRDAKGFAQELRHALSLKATEPASPDNPEREKVRQALQTGSFPALKAADPKAASRGLGQLVAQLGVFQEAELEPTATLLRKAGNDAIPALLHGMGHQHLAVRAGAYRTLQMILREQKRSQPAAFDAWAATKTRQAQLGRWTAWWKTQAVH
jgi:thioredoxin-like negative regulator of GroEL